MSADRGTVNLSKQEAMYLKTAQFLPSSLAELLRNTLPADGRSGPLSLSRQHAEEFRDAFTVRLATVGFDQNYEPTEEGRMLEQLIDSFFVP
jgi:hypothetical protein